MLTVQDSELVRYIHLFQIGVQEYIVDRQGIVIAASDIPGYGVSLVLRQLSEKLIHVVLFVPLHELSFLHLGIALCEVAFLVPADSRT